MKESKRRTVLTVILTGALALSLFFNMHLMNRLNTEKEIDYYGYVKELSFAQQRMKNYIETQKPYDYADSEYYTVLSHVYGAYTYSKTIEQKGPLYELWNLILFGRPAVEEQFPEIYKCIGNMKENPESKEAAIALQNLVESILLRQIEIQAQKAVS